MAADFSGQVVAVTGGASGIGAQICSQFTAAGAQVHALDVRGQHPEVTTHSLDVTDSAAVTRIVNSLGPIDVLVNSAAVAVAVGWHELTNAEWQWERSVALDGSFYMCRAVIPAMIDRGGGAIVNISSVNARGAYGQPAYSAAKAGLENLTKTLAVRYGPDGIRANAIAPGTVRTPAWDSRREANPQVFEELAQWYPLGRVGTAEDVAHATLFLASAEAAWITGTTLTVDGGLTAGAFRMISTADGSH